MTWSDFDLKSALERDVLRRALPAVPSSGPTYARVAYDPNASTAVAIGAQDVIGATPEGCVERLALRPLLVGAAWKVLDLLMEEALEQAGLVPDQSRGWSIARKEKETAKKAGKPAAISAAAWDALTATYMATVEIRHSLVHRRAHVDASLALVGVDSTGQALKPLSAAEQEAFARAVLTATDLILMPSVDSRVEARLLRQLADLGGLHGVAINTASVPDVIPEIKIIVDRHPAEPGRYLLDIPSVRANLPFPGTTHADVIVAPRDRPGQELRGRLEDAPDTATAMDPDSPPSWLT